MPKNPTKPTKLTKKQEAFLEIYKKNMCLISISCQKANINRSSYYDWMEKNEVFKQAVEQAQTDLQDFGEHALLKLVAQGHPQSVIFFNKTKNKNRGYKEESKLEVSGVNYTFTLHKPGEEEETDE